MKKIRSEQLYHDHEVLGLSFSSLASKYGISRSRSYRMVNKHKPKRTPARAASEELPDDVATLQALLRKEQLKNELLNNMIDIASKELDVDIRKKSGTRQSK